MRILIGNAHYAPASFGGATVIAEETAAGLRDRGHEVFVFTSTSDNTLGENRILRYEHHGIPVVAMRIPAVRTISQEYDYPPATEQFDHVLEAVQPDVVHLHAVQSLGSGLVAASQARGIPTVVTVHDAWWLCERQFMIRATGEYCAQTAIDPDICSTCIPDPAGHRARQSRSLRLLNDCAAVLAPSAFWRDLMVASGVSPQVAAVNGNGVSRPKPQWRRTARNGPARIGYVGGLSPVKGYPQLVAALQRIRRSDYELLVVDSFSNLGMVTMTHQDWPVAGLVRLVPGYNADNIDEFFDSIDVLVFPSQWKESYGLTVREAVLRGVWPILPEGGGTAEHMVSGRNATVYPRAGGVAALAEALDRYLDRWTDLTPDPSANEAIPTHDQQVAELEGYLLEAAASAPQPRPEAAQPASG